MEKIIEKLEKINKAYFSFQDLLRISKQKPPVLRVTISRLIAQKKLIPLSKGIYQLSNQKIDLENIAQQIYFPSYLSLESALAKLGILNQKPYSLTFITTKKSKKIYLLEQEIIYRQIKPDLFFGYQKIENLYLALPEKALLDQLYFISLGKASLDQDELNLNELSKTKFLKMSKKFPAPTQKLTKELVKNFGKISITVK